MKKIITVMMCIAISISLFGCMSKGVPVSTDEDDKKAVTALVEGFGQKLKDVSLLASAEQLKKSMTENYGTYVTADLLEKFLKDPLNAPGRLASKPWPDRIEVATAEKTSDGVYKVEGTVIEVTAAGQATSSASNKRSITLEVKKIDGKWLISSASLGNLTTDDSVIYRNTQYGFDFILPKSWSGYNVVADGWKGVSLEGSTSGQVTQTGPKLLIRHPQWTKENPREDIPIMVFTLAQWQLVEQEQISLGAAPVGPTELGRNSKYVFALPARYNYDFLTGYEEVEQIMEKNPLKAFELQ
jgi:hypothetical protein